VPEDGHNAGIALEAEEVEDKGVNNLVGEGVLLVEEDTDEKRVGTCHERRVSGSERRVEEKRRTGVVHLSKLQKSSSRVQYRDRDASEDRTEDGGFAKSAGSAL
jgi:hypothetical protein